MSSKKSVPQRRLSQKTGSKAAYGGYAKVQKANGSFRMQKTGKKR